MYMDSITKYEHCNTERLKVTRSKFPDRHTDLNQYASTNFYLWFDGGGMGGGSANIHSKFSGVKEI